MMTFEQFQRTKRWSTDLAADVSSDNWCGDAGKPCGWLYLDSLYIESWPDAARDGGRWHLILHRHEWITDDLESLERRLYQFAVDEGYITSSEPVS